ncbi:MAG TPA: DUF4872 domain-containing protein [Symbiobacteriaceae bacterium]|nr:DUF4872 domain-containing protein [Symbiobacteriaceae bacterium]
MPVLPAYAQFGSLHWETGSFGHALAYMGATAPHTGEPYSEAMLFGLSRGIGCMYFAFEFEGQEPYFFFSPRQVKVGGDMVADLCRRIGVSAHVLQTADRPEALTYLQRSLEEGVPVIIWADRPRLPWGWAPAPAGPWMAPVLVYGLDQEGMAHVADRARVPLTCPVDELAAAWGAQANAIHKAVTLRVAPEPFDPGAAVADAIRSCVDGFLSAPNAHFGLAALLKWADAVTDMDDRKGWPALFKDERLLYTNLVRAFMYIELEGTGGGAARPLYADFLEEAADVLNRPELRRAADRYRECGMLWTRLARTFLPDRFRTTREVLMQREARFRGAGLPGAEEGRRLDELAGQVDLPDPAGLRAEVRRMLLEVHRAEQDAVLALSESIH